MQKHETATEAELTAREVLAGLIALDTPASLQAVAGVCWGRIQGVPRVMGDPITGELSCEMNPVSDREGASRW
jgi:hypothetical protein